MAKNELTLTIKFNLSGDSFGNFCKALVAGGFENQVREIGKLVLAEARLRKLPIADEMIRVIEAKR
jgi:hypothetical protein